MADTKIGYIQGDADYLAIIYLWDIERDLDTCTYVKSPSLPILRDNYGIDLKYFAPVGYDWDEYIDDYPTEMTTDTPYVLQDLGDRTNNDPVADPDSVEATIINIAAIKKLYTDHPDLKNKYPYFDISSNIHWWSNGIEPPSGIDIRYDLFKGGSIKIDTSKHHMTPVNSTHVAGSSFSSIYRDTIHNVFQLRESGYDSWDTSTADKYNKRMSDVSNKYFYNAFTLRLDMSDSNNVKVYIIHGTANALSVDDLCALSLFGTDIFNGDVFNGKVGSKYIKDTDWHEVFGHTSNDPVSNTPSSRGVRIGDLLNGTLEIAPVNGYPSTSFESSHTYSPNDGNIWPANSIVHVDSSINTNITGGRILRTGDITPYSVYLSEYGKQQDPNKLVTRTDLTLRDNMDSLIMTPGMGALLYDLDLINFKEGDTLYICRSIYGVFPAPEAVYYAVQGDGNTISSIKKLSSSDIKTGRYFYTTNITSDMILKTNNSTRSRVLLFVKMATGEKFPNEWQYYNSHIYAALMPNGFTTADNASLYHNEQIRYIICSPDVTTLISDCFAGQTNMKQIYFLSPNAPTIKQDGSPGFTFVDSANKTAPNSNVTINYAKYSEGWTSGASNSAWSWAGIFNPNNYTDSTGNYTDIAANMSTWKLHELGYNSTMYSIWNNIIWNGEV